MTGRGNRAFTLIELLAVMAIIGILVALLMPTLAHMRTRARILEARSDVRQIAIGWGQYLLDYHRFPRLPITEMGPDAIAIMRGDAGCTNNPRGRPYMDFRTSTSNFCDPWGVPGTSTGVYHVALDTDLDGKVEHPDSRVEMPLHVIVWSDGPDRISGTKDDVGSWTEGQ